MRATAEIIDLRAVRERRNAAALAAAPVAPMPPMAWMPVWFFAPVWMYMPAAAGESRDG